MRYLIILLTMFCVYEGKAQQSFEFASESVALQFGAGGKVVDTKGFVLPSVLLSKSGINTANSNNFGTIFFDLDSASILYLVKANTWTKLTYGSGSINRVLSAFNQANKTALYTFSDTAENATQAGASVNGILEMKSDNKGFMLPHIQDPHDKILNPYPGFMCYDTRRGVIALFNGTEWHYWK